MNFSMLPLGARTGGTAMLKAVPREIWQDGVQPGKLSRKVLSPEGSQLSCERLNPCLRVLAVPIMIAGSFRSGLVSANMILSCPIVMLQGLRWRGDGDEMKRWACAQ